MSHGDLYQPAVYKAHATQNLIYILHWNCNIFSVSTYFNFFLKEKTCMCLARVSSFFEIKENAEYPNFCEKMLLYCSV